MGLKKIQIDSQSVVPIRTQPALVLVQNESLTPSVLSLPSLNYLYLGLVLNVCIYFVDRVLFNRFLSEKFPTGFDFALWFNVVFNFPHIVSSTLLMVNPEALTAYKSKLVVFFLGLLALGAVMMVWKSRWLNGALLLMGLTWTVKHVIGQQFKMGLLYLKKRTLLHQWWVHSGTVIAVPLFMYIYLPWITQTFELNYTQAAHLQYLGDTFIKPFCFAYLVLTLYLTFRTAGEIENKEGRNYVYFNFLMVALSFFFVLDRYYFLAILGPRVIHDLTAFYCYSNCAQNRNQATNSWNVYSIFKKAHIPALAYVMGVSCIVGFSYVYCAERYAIPLIGPVLGLLHFYTESFTWKRGSHLKQYLRISLT